MVRTNQTHHRASGGHLGQLQELVDDQTHHLLLLALEQEGVVASDTADQVLVLAVRLDGNRGVICKKR